ncbi:hypothetical protein [Klebsiella phage PhiKpNIH-6]|uniref:Uncharacterized protein n=1 Tax=Klebsiella phage PhiKpNIH-6 TaxID=2689112 RepID=A0A6B9LPW9_9CAUD|nr:hypothetical protein [Klebsiella phage PhiKpNIH-6]
MSNLFSIAPNEDISGFITTAFETKVESFNIYNLYENVDKTRLI